MVGSILIRRCRPGKENDNHHHHHYQDGDDEDDDEEDLRSSLESVTVFVAGYCKIDARWHNVAEYRDKIYGPRHPFVKQLQKSKGFDTDSLLTSTSSKTSAATTTNSNSKDGVVCFWATNGLECLDLPERKVGAWRDWSTGQDDYVADDNEGSESDKSSEEGSENEEGYEDETEDEDETDEEDSADDTDDSNKSLLPKNLLAFTFRVDLPLDLPHSLNACTCCYFYTAHVLLKTSTEQQVLNRNFQVTTHPHHPPPSKNDAATSGRVKFGTCLGMAHSIGLPCHLSSMDINRPKGQMTVRAPLDPRLDQRDMQTIRVSTTEGRPVCLLTVVGSQNLKPDSRIQLQWDFPSTEQQGLCDNADGHTHEHKLVLDHAPCYQVAACLQGEEHAVYEDGTTRRTKSFLLDTCHEYVMPEVTETVTKTLWLDGSRMGGDRFPCSLTTDIMELSVWCQVDITVLEDNPENNKSTAISTSNYSNLSLNIPVRIRHYLENEDEVIEQQENRVAPLSELLGLPCHTKIGHGTDFPTGDILMDLKTLSLKVEEVVGKGERVY